MKIDDLHPSCTPTPPTRKKAKTSFPSHSKPFLSTTTKKSTYLLPVPAKSSSEALPQEVAPRSSHVAASRRHWEVGGDGGTASRRRTAPAHTEVTFDRPATTYRCVEARDSLRRWWRRRGRRCWLEPTPPPRRTGTRVLPACFSRGGECECTGGNRWAVVRSNDGGGWWKGKTSWNQEINKLGVGRKTI